MLKRRVLRGILLLAVVSLFVLPVTLAQAQTGTGTGKITDSQSSSDVIVSDRITITMTDVPPAGANMAYEAWIVSDNGSTRVSLGVLNVTDGRVNHTYTSPDGKNLFSLGDKLQITKEPVPDPNPSASTTVAFSAQIPAAAMAHIRHLTYSWSPNPPYASGPHSGTPKGIAVGLREQTRLALTHANLGLNSTTLAEVKMHAEHVANIIDGGTGTDHDGDGTVGNPGDKGPGVLGYAADTKNHANLTKAAAPANQNIQTFGTQAADSADGVADRANAARSAALSAVNAGDISLAKLYMENARTALERALNGFDANRDGTITPDRNEGGVNQAYTAAQMMGTYNIQPGTGGPVTGDISYTSIALGSLLGGLILVLAGGFVYRRSRSLARG